MGTLFVIFFWQALARADSGRGAGPIRGAAPDPIVYLNPFLAQADIAPSTDLCASDNALRYYCRFRSEFLLDQNGVIFLGNDTVSPDVPIFKGEPAVGGGGGAVNLEPGGKFQAVPAGRGGFVVVPLRDPSQVAPVVAFGGESDSIWQKTVVSWLVLSLIFLVLSVQFVSPTRRWHLRRRPSQRGGSA
jgi:hypothetical protein